MGTRAQFDGGVVIGGYVCDECFRYLSLHLIEKPTPHCLFDSVIVNYHDFDARLCQSSARLGLLYSLRRTFL